MFRSRLIPTLILLTSPLATSAKAQTVHETIDGPVSAEIIRVVDGDTILVEAMPWPQQTIEVYVRLRGIDAPELHSKCEEVRAAALKAQEALEAIMPATGEIELTRISGDKYFGRILADVTTKDGRNPAHDLLQEGYAVSYNGGRKPVQPCGSDSD
ncbi:thermonuclease family protein [Rhizobium sp. BK376]|jgi:endonuclease YncB( thermonuclease family)|uniref:thermonuclease family protein n=1 Tax=Rhizobium sp. BK376 TaxID=2512149 RepID=UPI0010530BB4|nr:thermonuclease family protein [Rhizobium sp. BK376]TCR90208.1 nuclease-like protein [Rhizobium sp. BK376]